MPSREMLSTTLVGVIVVAVLAIAGWMGAHLSGAEERGRRRRFSARQAVPVPVRYRDLIQSGQIAEAVLMRVLGTVAEAYAVDANLIAPSDRCDIELRFVGSSEVDEARIELSRRVLADMRERRREPDLSKIETVRGLLLLYTEQEG